MLLSYFFDSSKDESSIYPLLFSFPAEIIINAIILLLLLLVIFTFYAP